MVIRIVGGCYDGSIHGWEWNGNEFGLKFAYKCHQSCTKCLGVSSSEGKIYLASGGTDEIVKVYQLDKVKELGELFQHQDTILSLCFIGNKYLLSGGKDGQLILWRCKDWEIVSTLKGHKPGPVTSVAVHPSGKVALSTSNDNSLRMWNLETARSASRNRLEGFSRLDLVKFCPNGNYYGVVGDDRTVMLFSVEDTSGKPLHSIQFDERVNALMFTSNESLVIGLEHGRVKTFTVEDGKEQKKLELECKARVRDLGFFIGEDGKNRHLVAGLSNGEIQIWNYEKKTCDTILHVGSGTHLTGMVCQFSEDKTKKRKPEDDKRQKNKKKKNKKQ